MNLHPADRKHLVEESAISEDVLTRHGVYTAETPEQLPEGFDRDRGGITPAIVFPRCDDAGTCVAQVKPRLGEDRDQPYRNHAGHESKYLVPKGSGSLLWSVRPVAEPSRVVLCEGTKQALSLASWAPEDVAVYSLAGCQNWKSDALPLPSLSAVSGADAVILLDGDAATNRRVFDAGMQLHGACANEGATSVRFVRLHTGDSRGIDDLLASRSPHRRGEFMSALLANTYPRPAERRPSAKSASGDGIDSDREQVIATDSQVADAYVSRYVETVQLCAGGGAARWVAFDAERGRWSFEKGSTLARTRVHDLRSHIQAITHTTDKDGLPVTLDETAWLETSTRLNAVLSEAATREQMHIDLDSFDAIPDTAYLLTVANGTVDLRTGALLEHNPAHYITQRSPVIYDPHATCPRFEGFLAEVVPEPEMREFLARLFGLALIGEVTEHRLPVFLGSGRNGKGALLRIASAVFGGYHAGIDKSLLIRTKFEEHSTVIANLWRKRLVTTEEFADSAQWDIPRIKELTGGDSLTGRFMRADSFTFIPSHTLILASNSWPSADITEEAFWSRVMRIPFEQQIERPDYRMESEIKTRELAGVLSWMVRGCQDYLEHGLGEPPQILVATQQARVESSVVGRFLHEQVEVTGSADDGITKNDLREGYLTWLRRAGPGGAPISMDRFVREIRSLNHPGLGESAVRVRRDANGSPCDRVTRYWTGLRWSDPGGRSPQWGPDDSPDGDQFGDSIDSSFSQVGARGDLWGPVNTRTTQREKAPYTGEGEGGSYRREEINRENGSPQVSGSPRPEAVNGPLVLDLETADARELFTRAPGEFVRLAGYTECPSDPSATRITEHPGELVAAIESGTGPVIGHNILGFDLLALATHHGLDLPALANSDRIRDTRLLAQLVDPPWAGKFKRNTRGYYSLDQVASRLGVAGKTDDLAALAKAHGGFDKIPTGDPEFREYLRGDVTAASAVAELLPVDDYARREHRVVARLAATSVTGFRVDTELLNQRLADGAQHRERLIEQLHTGYGLPLVDEKGKAMRSPAATTAGKNVLQEAFAHLGIRLPKTATGAPSLSKQTLTALRTKFADRPDVVGLCDLVLALNGIRTVYATVSEHLTGDRVHPVIWPGQSSGRWSVTNPGMTVLGKRAGKHVEREIFLPEPGEVLLAADLDQVDMRAVAALSGDREYRKLFEPGMDAHTEIARRAFGDASRREDAKAIGHGWNYGRSANAMIEQDGIDPEKAITFCREMAEQFPDVVAWQESVRAQARETELLDNGYGRTMRCAAGEAHTEAPALCGQGCARDMLVDGILNLPAEVAAMLRTVVHDELIFSVPADSVPEVSAAIREALTVECYGVPVTAGVTGPASNWGALYAK